MAKRAQIQPERLGKNLRAHDVLMPPAEEAILPPAVEEPRVQSDIEASKHHDAKESKLQREPTTIRFTKATLKEIARARSHFLLEEDLKITQSDLVEAAVLRALHDLPAFGADLRQRLGAS